MTNFALKNLKTIFLGPTFEFSPCPAEKVKPGVRRRE